MKDPVHLLKQRSLALCLLLWCWFGLTGLAVSAQSGKADADLVAIPALASRVTDLTGTLTASQADSLEQKLAAFEKHKGSQIALLLVPSTQPEAIEQYSLRVAEQWKLGRKKVDDGLLLIVAKGDRRLRFEVGYGLEGAVNDLTAQRIISEVITPYFRQGLYFEGINAGLDRVMQVIDGEALPAPVKKPVAQNGAQGDSMEGILLLACMLSLFLGGILKKILGNTLGGIATGGIVAGLAFFMTGAVMIASLAAAVGYFASLFGGLGGRGGAMLLQGGAGLGQGRGGFRGGGGFGGGFGGGGGGFGGGGASGRW